ncbi:MAG TPA: TonB family protein [Brevundimonas sp.]|nr:TonB family protein [Brevundimonas sp.]
MTRVAVIASLLALAASPAAAQDPGDDWDLTVDEAGQLTLASAGYSSGQAIAVRCKAGVIDVLVSGLPSLDGRSRYLELTLGEHPTETGYWITDGALIFSTTPARSARQFREGGQLKLSVAATPEADSPLRQYLFELPPRSASVDRVLETCGAPLADARDDLPRWNQPRVFSPTLWSRHPVAEYPQAAARAGIESGFAVLGCIVGEEGQLQDCRIERESDRRAGFGDAALRSMRLARLSLTSDGAPRAGEVMTLMIRFQVA